MTTSFKWGTVTAVSPLTVKLDGDTAALLLTPGSLVDPATLLVNDRVRVELTSNKAIVHGTSGGLSMIVVGDDGHKYRFVSGVIRNGGSPNYWQPISDGSHSPVGVDTVSTDSTKITVNYDFTADKVVSLVCVPDETMAKEGFTIGASVSSNHADIYISRHKTIGDYVSYNGSVWSSQNGVFTGLSFSAGTLQMTNEKMFGLGASVSGRGAVRAALSDASSAITSVLTKISWYDAAGALITTAASTMKAFVTRADTSPGGVIDPRTAIDTTDFPNHNIWFFGIFEIG